MPVVLNSVLEAVTKMTATRLPARSGSAYQGYWTISFGLHGSRKEAGGGG
jgi:hypothetical protein